MPRVHPQRSSQYTRQALCCDIECLGTLVNVQITHLKCTHRIYIIISTTYPPIDPAIPQLGTNQSYWHNQLHDHKHLQYQIQAGRQSQAAASYWVDSDRTNDRSRKDLSRVDVVDDVDVILGERTQMLIRRRPQWLGLMI